MSFLKEYTLLGELGKGGFAKVYKVRHNELGYIRAIRVLNESIADEKSHTYQKFLHECKVLLRLGNGNHRNIVHIYQPRLLDNHALVEMDYVDGQDLTHYLKENGSFLPIEEVLRMVQEMSNALSYCHEDIYQFCMDPDEDDLQNDPVDGRRWLIDATTRTRLVDKYKVIHNDIHSGNIMRRKDGSFVLLDFGLAIEGDEVVKSSSRHENGAVEFKAPEKWDNDTTLTEQSDVYSFGIVMYEYLAGRVPFPYDENLSKVEAEYKLLKAHAEQTPPPIGDLRKAYFEAKYPNQTYKKDYPDWLEAAILRCLEKNPAKRFRNGKELYDYISKHLQDETVTKEAFQSLSDELESIKDERQQTLAQIATLTKQLQEETVAKEALQGLSDEVVSLKGERQQAFAQIAALTKQLHDETVAKEALQGLSDEVASLKDERQQALAQITVLTKKNNDLARLADSVSEELKQARQKLESQSVEQNAKLHRELAVLQGTIKQREVEIASLQGDLMKLERRAQDSQVNEDLQNQIVFLQKQSEDLERQVNQAQQEKRKLRDEVERLKKSGGKKRPLPVILCIFLGMAAVVLGVLYFLDLGKGNGVPGDYESVMAENGNLKQNNEDLTQQVSNLESRNEALSKQVDLLQNELDNIPIDDSEGQARIAELNEKITALNMEIERLKDMGDEQSSNNAELTNQLNTANSTISGLQAEIKKLKKPNQTSTAREKELEDELATVRKSLASANGKIEEQKKTIEEQKKTIEEQKNTIAKLTREMEVIKDVSGIGK
jgi:serine/threonine protein kinase